MDLLNIKPNIVSKGVAGKYFLFYGDPSTRKTSVACRFPDALLLATEIGYSMIPGVHAVNIDSWATFREVVRELKRPEVRSRYKTIVVDTVGLLTDMCLKYVLIKNDIKDLSELGWGKGWNEFKREFREQINFIAQLGYAVVFIAHSDTKRDENGKVTSALPQMEKRPREAVMALVDFILFLQKEEKEGHPEEITVYAYSKLASTIESKTRARYLSPKFEFTFENLEHEISLAIEAYEKEGDGNMVTEAVINQHEHIQSVPFDKLKDQVYELAKTLLANEVLAPEAQKAMITIMKGVKISEATAIHYDQLAALKEALIEIRG